MLGVSGAVRLLDLGPRDGVVKGVAGPYRWEARMARGPVSYGLDPVTMYKGNGRIVRLVLYEQVTGAGLGRKIAAFDRGWLFGRTGHLAAIRRIVTYLER